MLECLSQNHGGLPRLKQMILLVVLLVLLAHADATAAVQISTFPVLYYEYIEMCIH